jgi:glyceraldehyde-3-phosphate dehydrogenase/erythrose-4-phosphate dehydrogenase
MTQFQALIAQSPSTPQPPPGLTEWGVLGAIVFLVVKEGITFLKDKDSTESNLTNVLITDIRNTNADLREYLEKQRKTADSIVANLDRVEQKLSRNQTEIVVAHRESLARLTAMVAAIHVRLDAAGISTSHHNKSSD